MKNYLKTLFVGALALTVGLGTVEAATATQKINANACETVYTNYYFFLDANTESFFNKSELSKITHNTVAEYHNNSYQISNFDTYNVGFGQMNVSRTSTTSRDGITSISLSDFYDIVLRASRITGGSYSEGANNYIYAHDWYSYNADGTANKESNTLNISGLSRSQLMDATVDANSTFTRESRISASAPNPFVVRINRNYFGYLTGKPFRLGSYNWYVHPSVYYVQYCSPKANDIQPVRDTYTITYYGNFSDVTNVPGKQEAYIGDCEYISNQRPVRPGYKFLGWSESRSSTKPEWLGGDKYCGQKGNLVLYAIWEKEPDPIKHEDPVVQYYNVFYKPNTSDRVDAMPADSTNIPNDRDVYIASNVPQRTGWTFLGWNTDPSATVASHPAGMLYQDRKDLVLYAIWQKNPDPIKPDDPGLPNNPQTGIEDYFLPLGGLALVSGFGLRYMKKRIYKNL